MIEKTIKNNFSELKEEEETAQADGQPACWRPDVQRSSLTKEQKSCSLKGQDSLDTLEKAMHGLEQRPGWEREKAGHPVSHESYKQAPSPL